MEDSLRDKLVTVCKLLEQYGVGYMLIGGTAVALNGYYRHSVDAAGQLTDKPDIDIWYHPTYENYFNVLNALEALGQNVQAFKEELNPNPRESFFKLEFDDFTFDLLPQIKANINFVEANKRRETVVIDGTSIHFMGYTDLIKDKEATARKKDLEDIEHLKKAQGEK